MKIIIKKKNRKMYFKTTSNSQWPIIIIFLFLALHVCLCFIRIRGQLFWLKLITTICKLMSAKYMRVPILYYDWSYDCSSDCYVEGWKKDTRVLFSNPKRTISMCFIKLFLKILNKNTVIKISVIFQSRTKLLFKFTFLIKKLWQWYVWAMFSNQIISNIQ